MHICPTRSTIKSQGEKAVSLDATRGMGQGLCTCHGLEIRLARMPLGLVQPQWCKDATRLPWCDVRDAEGAKAACAVPDIGPSSVPLERFRLSI